MNVGEQCPTCGTRGSYNSTGRFVTEDWMWTQDLRARISELESANSTLVRWKGEIDSRRIALGLLFPDDYDSSPKYAVETLIESALAKSASREAALVEAIDCCYRMLISEADTRQALFKAENILRDAIAKIKIKEAS